MPAPRLPQVTEPQSMPSSGSVPRRVLDFLLALTGLLLLLPVFFAIALAIKFDDGGAVFFQQERIGRHFRIFRVYKFRSMITGAERDGLLTAPADPRKTRVGRWLRRYKLDELPQLFNILNGDMQFVGARPEVECYVQMFRSQYAEILQERPGITDPATLVYRREEEMFSAVRFEQQYIEEILPAKIKLSLAYQKQRTLLTDAQVFMRTALGFFT